MNNKAPRLNPFHELFAAESVWPKDFVKVFSPFLVEHALALFQPGNVVLKGVEGSGKSMLLNLLKPEVRIAYAKARHEFPVPRPFRRFIGAGISLVRSVVIDFGQRQIEDTPERDAERLPIYFGDFLNYWVVRDLLRTIDTLAGEAPELARATGIAHNGERLEAFAKAVCREACWFDYLASTSSYEDLKGRLEARIRTYRDFLNFNLERLPDEIRHSKTSIGEPISRTVECLWESNVVARDVACFVRIDQYEWLRSLEEVGGLGLQYRAVVNKALGLRDPRVSYRIGTKRYGWDDSPQIFASGSRLELQRDYRIIDLDDVLRRKENTKRIFPSFARDVFQRRIALAGLVATSPKQDPLRAVFGPALTARELAVKYAGKSGTQAVRIEADWPEKFRSRLAELAKTDPLEARLLEAWLRQKVGKLGYGVLPSGGGWSSKTTKWWTKERVPLALMQIAARCRQRMVWGGVEDVLALSGGNILVFLTLCQEIWAAWLRSIRGVTDAAQMERLPRVGSNEQTVGIYSASTYWYQKIGEAAAGDSRQRFVDHVGRLLRETLVKDVTMSYPGRNGFSLPLLELSHQPIVRKFLNEAVSYGALFDAPHTTKEADRLPRWKWYLNPILSPHFQIPVTHEKEPLYIGIAIVVQWLVASGAMGFGEIQAGVLQPRLFGE